jgi:hypothetical protein
MTPLTDSDQTWFTMKGTATWFMARLLEPSEGVSFMLCRLQSPI